MIFCINYSFNFGYFNTLAAGMYAYYVDYMHGGRHIFFYYVCNVCTLIIIVKFLKHLIKQANNFCKLFQIFKLFKHFYFELKKETQFYLKNYHYIALHFVSVIISNNST